MEPSARFHALTPTPALARARGMFGVARAFAWGAGVGCLAAPIVMLLRGQDGETIEGARVLWPIMLLVVGIIAVIVLRRAEIRESVRNFRALQIRPWQLLRFDRTRLPWNVGFGPDLDERQQPWVVTGAGTAVHIGLTSTAIVTGSAALAIWPVDFGLTTKIVVAGILVVVAATTGVCALGMDRRAEQVRSEQFAGRMHDILKNQNRAPSAEEVLWDRMLDKPQPTIPNPHPSKRHETLVDQALAAGRKPDESHAGLVLVTPSVLESRSNRVAGFAVLIASSGLEAAVLGSSNLVVTVSVVVVCLACVAVCGHFAVQGAASAAQRRFEMSRVLPKFNPRGVDPE